MTLISYYASLCALLCVAKNTRRVTFGKSSIVGIFPQYRSGLQYSDVLDMLNQCMSFASSVGDLNIKYMNLRGFSKGVALLFCLKYHNLESL